MKGQVEFRWTYRRDQMNPQAQYRFEYYTVKRHGPLGIFKTYDRIWGKWIDFKPAEIVYFPAMKSMYNGMANG